MLVGLVEVDRGTERGDRHWSQKVADYDGLFASGALPGLTGYQKARVLVFTPNLARRDQLAKRLEAWAQEQNIHDDITAKLWLTDMSLSFTLARMTRAAWKKVGHESLAGSYFGDASHHTEDFFEKSMEMIDSGWPSW